MTPREQLFRMARASPSFSTLASGRRHRFRRMGSLYYGGSEPIHIEDRALAHLKVVVATKLRRNESFTLTWKHPEGDSEGRSTVWLHPSIPLRFVFDETETPVLSRRWIEDLAHSASSSGGITLVDEVIDASEDLETADSR
jgi:hypothetical protein